MNKVSATQQKYKKKQEVPLYHRIKDELRRRISDGQWTTGQALPNRNILTAEFGTTRITLDKAIQQLVDEGLLTSARGSGTYVAPQRAIRPRRSINRQSLRVGVVLGSYIPAGAEMPEGDTDHIYFGPVLRGISAGLTGQPVEAKYASVTAEDYLDYFHREELDGLIVLTAAVSDIPHLHKLVESRVPFVAIGISSPSPKDSVIPTIDASNRKGGAAAAKHLLDLGHRRIGCVNLSTSHANHMDRLMGFEEAMESAGFPIDPDLLCLNPVYDIDKFDTLVDEWLEKLTHAGKMPTAIIACDFSMTLTTLGALRRRYMAVPNDVSLVGFDDPLSAAHLSPPLTTVRQPVYAIGLHAANRLLQALQDPEGPRPVTGPEFLDTEVIVRKSTCPPRVVG